MSYSKRILIVDDDESIIRYLTRILELVGHPVGVARNGAEGLEKVLSFEPDTIFLDFNMPHKNGEEFLEHLRHDQLYAKHADTYVIGIGDFDQEKLQKYDIHVPKTNLSLKKIKTHVSGDMLQPNYQI